MVLYILKCFLFCTLKLKLFYAVSFFHFFLYFVYDLIINNNGAQWFEQFLQVSWQDPTLVLLGSAFSLPGISVSSVFTVLYIFKFFLVHFLLYLLVSRAWKDWFLTSLTSHCTSVVWDRLLGYLTCKLFPKWPTMCRVGWQTLLLLYDPYTLK